MPPASDGIFYWQNLVLLALAGLVSNTAAGLASGLARSLALAAAAVLGALAQVFGIQCLNTLHGCYPQRFYSFLYFTTLDRISQSVGRQNFHDFPPCGGILTESRARWCRRRPTNRPDTARPPVRESPRAAVHQTRRGNRFHRTVPPWRQIRAVDSVYAP